MNFIPQTTGDGSFTFYSDEFEEAFHSHHGAATEAQKKFIEPCQIENLARQQTTIKILDICFGLGYNSAAAWQRIWEINPHCIVEWYGLESDPRVPHTAIAQNLLQGYGDRVNKLMAQVITTEKIITPHFVGQLLIGDARQTLQRLMEQPWQADAIFLDPFSPPKCPQLWTVEFLGLVANSLAPNGYLATYSCAGAVRQGLILNNLVVASTPSFGRKAPGTIARHQGHGLPPLPPQEQEHLGTTAAIPYRDPPLTDTPEIIIKRRQQEQQTTTAEPTKVWKKRWGLR